MSFRKQAENFGLALLILAILSGIFYLASSIIELILSVILKDNTAEQNNALAKVITGVIFGVLIILATL